MCCGIRQSISSPKIIAPCRWAVAELYHKINNGGAQPVWTLTRPSLSCRNGALAPRAASLTTPHLNGVRTVKTDAYWA
jgi:hypothetical protein